MSKPGIVKFLYTQNPFYLIGTAILLYGLRIATDSGDYFSTNPHALPLILGMVMVVMALTAITIIKFGGVWDDARTIVLSILILAVNAVTCCDATVLSQPMTTAAILGVRFSTHCRDLGNASAHPKSRLSLDVATAILPDSLADLFLLVVVRSRRHAAMAVIVFGRGKAIRIRLDFGLGDADVLAGHPSISSGVSGKRHAMELASLPLVHIRCAGRRGLPAVVLHVARLHSRIRLGQSDWGSFLCASSICRCRVGL